MAETRRLKALYTEHGQIEVRTHLGIVRQIIEFLFGAGLSQKCAVCGVPGAIDALDAQIGLGEQADGPLQSLTAQPPRFGIPRDQRHRDIDDIDADLFEKSQVVGTFQPFGRDPCPNKHQAAFGSSLSATWIKACMKPTQ